jgi:VWFA-related protein
MKSFRMDGDDSRTLDAINRALDLLDHRPPGRRRIILLIAEKKDRGSETPLPAVVERVQRTNTAIYWLTYSPFLQPFTVRSKTNEDLKPESERIKVPECAWCPKPDNSPAPPDLGPGSLLYGLGELKRLKQPDLSELFTRSTGGKTDGFLKKNALENAIQRIGEEVHRQYVLNFEPKGGEPGSFHKIRIFVKDRPELTAKTREGYWVVQ